MKMKLYQIDAFTNQVFSGNPAAVFPLKKPMNDQKNRYSVVTLPTDLPITDY
jgi:predicted PhzF superfamily epimerase YddE/YHI9